jgi:hypothetical protein
MNQYTWTVNSMYTLPVVGDYQDVVVVATYTVSGTDGTYTASLGSNSCQFEAPSSDFTPYAQLTNDQVVGWIQDTIGADGVASYQSSIDGMIASQANPPIEPTSQTLPWAN